MGYMLPLRFIKVSTNRTIKQPNKKDIKQKDVAICATRIVALMSTDIYQARKAIYNEKKQGTLINACGTGAAKTAIFLDNGTVIASPLSISVIMNQIEKSNGRFNTRRDKRLRVYDVYDENPSKDTEEDIDDLSAIYEEDAEDEQEEFIIETEEEEDEDEYEDEDDSLGMLDGIDIEEL